MNKQEKKRLTLVTDHNGEYGPALLHGLEAVDVAEKFGLAIQLLGHYVEDKYEKRPNLTPTAARGALEAAPANLTHIHCDACEYRGYTIILEGDEPRILDGDHEVVAFLHKEDKRRGAALFLDGLLRGQQEGSALGRAVARQEIADTASLFLGPLIQPVVQALGRIEDRVEEGSRSR